MVHSRCELGSQGMTCGVPAVGPSTRGLLQPDTVHLFGGGHATGFEVQVGAGLAPVV